MATIIPTHDRHGKNVLYDGKYSITLIKNNFIEELKILDISTNNEYLVTISDIASYIVKNNETVDIKNCHIDLENDMIILSESGDNWLITRVMIHYCDLGSFLLNIAVYRYGNLNQLYFNNSIERNQGKPMKIAIIVNGKFKEYVFANGNWQWYYFLNEVNKICDLKTIVELDIGKMDKFANGYCKETKIFPDEHLEELFIHQMKHGNIEVFLNLTV